MTQASELLRGARKAPVGTPNGSSETSIENLAVATLSASGGAVNANYSFEIVSDSTGGAFAVSLLGCLLLVLRDKRRANTREPRQRYSQ